VSSPSRSGAPRLTIQGAGPSGLVAAKTLTHDHPKDVFHVTIFEQGDRIGGLWPSSKKDPGMVNPDMCTNQSMHTVSFSDHAWPEGTPAFPKAWQVGEYLQQYVQAYDAYRIRLGCKVVKASLQNGIWEVQIRDKQSPDLENLSFDHVIVATGFFGRPKIPPVLEGFAAPVWHSSRLRGVENLLADGAKPPPSPGRNIVVVGGQMSGVEVAASMAMQLSSEVNSPGAKLIPNANEYSITHIVQQPVWIMPLFFPNDPYISGSSPEQTAVFPPCLFTYMCLPILQVNHAPTFLPVDLVMYNLGWRPPGPLQNQSGHIAIEKATITHGFMNKYIGSDQSDLGASELAMVGDARTQPPYVALSDEYIEFVRSGNIKVIKGKVIGGSLDHPNSIIMDDAGDHKVVEDVEAVVLATGFDASPSLDFLPEEILQTLQFEPACDEFPLALNVNCAASRSIPSLGFVGFYRSPYWGVMEMQARYLGKLWSGDEAAAKALEEDKTVDTMLKLRRDPRRAQFPMGDYAYLMESFASILGIRRFQPENANARTGLVLPARYSYDVASDKQKTQIDFALTRFYDTFSRSEKDRKYLARAVFRALQGDWKLEREITSFISSYPSGRLTGSAKLLPRFPTKEGFDLEYLYLEKGDFTTTTGLHFSANRRFVLPRIQ
jgi:hypothetical protein